MEYDNFVFYGRWRELLQAFDETTAKEILWQIMLLGTSGEMSTDNQMIISIIRGAVEINMNKAKDRYNSAQKSKGRQQKYSSEEIKELKKQGMENQEITDTIGCSLRTVQRALQEDDDEEL